MYPKEVYDQIKAISAELRPDCIRFIQKLIQTPSISGEEEALANVLIKEMEKLGYDRVFRDDVGNVIGIIQGEDGPVLMFNSHMDHVAPGDIENWEGYDPYGGQIDICECDSADATYREKVECIHGRGASDVKSGHGFQIYAGAILIKLREQGIGFKGTFMYTGVVHEESAEQLGMRYLLTETFPKENLKFDAMVSSEATSLRLYLGHRGRIEYLIKVHGRTSHGSCPQKGINAIYKAMSVVDRIKSNIIPNLPKDPDGELEDASISLNIIECSPGSLSIVPDLCLLSLDRRTIPGETEESIMIELQKILDEIVEEDPEFKAEVQIKVGHEVSYTGLEFDIKKSCAPWKIKKDHPFVQACADALSELDYPVEYGYWSFGTDAHFSSGELRIPTIGYSAMQEQYAHTPFDKCRIDFIEKAMAGNAAIFMKASQLPRERFEKLDF